jgi:hypothetical protein
MADNVYYVLFKEKQQIQNVCASSARSYATNHKTRETVHATHGEARTIIVEYRLPTTSPNKVDTGTALT